MSEFSGEGPFSSDDRNPNESVALKHDLGRSALRWDSAAGTSIYIPRKIVAPSTSGSDARKPPQRGKNFTPRVRIIRPGLAAPTGRSTAHPNPLKLKGLFSRRTYPPMAAWLHICSSAGGDPKCRHRRFARSSFHESIYPRRSAGGRQPAVYRGLRYQKVCP